MNVSKLAENIIGSEIIKLAGEVNEKIKKGEGERKMSDYDEQGGRKGDLHIMCHLGK